MVDTILRNNKQKLLKESKIRLQSNYSSLDEFEQYSETYSVYERLNKSVGYIYDSIEDMWEANPMIYVSTNPSDLRIISKKGQNESNKVFNTKRVESATQVKSKRNFHEGYNEIADTDAERELYLYVDNDGELYRQMRRPIELNYKKKLDKGVFDNELGVKGLMHLVDAGARKYKQEFGSSFDVQTRRNVAKALLDDILAEYGANKLESKNHKRYEMKIEGRNNSKEINIAGSNLYIRGFGIDFNGNKVVYVGTPNERSFSIQTNGVLRNTNEIDDMQEAEMKIDEISDEILNYVKKYGSPRVKSHLRFSTQTESNRSKIVIENTVSKFFKSFLINEKTMKELGYRKAVLKLVKEAKLSDKFYEVFEKVIKEDISDRRLDSYVNKLYNGSSTKVVDNKNIDYVIEGMKSLRKPEDMVFTKKRYKKENVVKIIKTDELVAKFSETMGVELKKGTLSQDDKKFTFANEEGVEKFSAEGVDVFVKEDFVSWYVIITKDEQGNTYAVENDSNNIDQAIEEYNNAKQGIVSDTMSDDSMGDDSMGDDDMTGSDDSMGDDDMTGSDDSMGDDDMTGSDDSMSDDDMTGSDDSITGNVDETGSEEPSNEEIDTDIFPAPEPETAETKDDKDEDEKKKEKKESKSYKKESFNVGDKVLIEGNNEVYIIEEMESNDNTFFAVTFEGNKNGKWRDISNIVKKLEKESVTTPSDVKASVNAHIGKDSNKADDEETVSLTKRMSKRIKRDGK